MRPPRAFVDAVPFAAMILAIAAAGAALTLLAPAGPGLYVLIIPPLLILALLPLARLAAKAGTATSPTGEFDHLLRRKRDGLLDLSRPRFESRIEDERGPARAMQERPAQADEPDALDRLVEWKRRRWSDAVMERV